MKLILPVVLLMFGVAACNQNSSTPKMEEAPAAAEKKPIDIQLAEFASPKDPVCGMPLRAGEIADTTMHEGGLYGFCASECKAEFEKNPQSYLTQK